MNWTQSWAVFATASAVFAALTAVFGKLGVAHINSNLATFIRTVVILALIAAVVSVRGQWRMPHRLPGRDVLWLVLSALATGASWLCYYRALQLGPASRVAPVDKLSVLFAIVLAVLFLGEAFTWKLALGGALMLAGAVVLVL